MVSLNTQVDQLNKVGKTTHSRLKRLGIEIIEDLIFYYPFRYDDFSVITKIKDLKVGMSTTVVGKIELISSRRTKYKRKNLTEALVTDQTGSIKVIWFNQPWISKTLKPGDEISLSGKVAGDPFNVYLNSPEYEKIDSSGIHTGRVVPIYPLTDGLTQKQIRFLINEIIYLAEKVEDYIPIEIIKKQGLISLPQAIKQIHSPQNKKEIEQAKTRLAFDELFLIQLWSKILKKQLSSQESYKINFFEKETKEFVSSLGFDLTDDQRKSTWEVIRNMESGKPMNRLVEGDVGSGKTLVAAITAYNVALNKKQSAFLAPTEILAKQHFDTLNSFFGDKVRIGLFTGSQKFIGEEIVTKNEFLTKCQNGEVDIVIGTHAIIQKNVFFNNLAFVVVDEQHRFGVAQRQALKQKSKKVPHFLSLTATPIPRSLALTIYGDLDISIIRQVPSGRKKIITKLVPPNKRMLAYDFIAKQVEAGRQVFVVCPLIDLSDKLGARSAKEEFEKIDKQIFPNTAIGLLHGKLKSVEKERVMADFLNGDTKILVTTSVIEVGVDVKNATVMMIEDADRFGLAQLHQFRGRVGRDGHQSYCFLFSEKQDPKTLERLNSLVQCNDGFALAQQDLKYRGGGQIYGYDQSGFSGLKIATLDNLLLVNLAVLSAKDFIDNYCLDDFPQLKEKLDNMNFNSHLE